MLTKVHLVKAVIFPVVMYRCERWTIKKAEHWRIDAFELWCWKRLLRVPWTAMRSNQSILKEINPEYSFKDWCRSSSTLATWCEEPIHWERPWCWEWLRGRTFVNKVMSLLLNMLSRLVITFLPRSKRLLISWLHSPSAVILEPKK